MGLTQSASRILMKGSLGSIEGVLTIAHIGGHVFHALCCMYCGGLRKYQYAMWSHIPWYGHNIIYVKYKMILVMALWAAFLGCWAISLHTVGHAFFI